MFLCLLWPFPATVPQPNFAKGSVDFGLWISVDQNCPVRGAKQSFKYQQDIQLKSFVTVFDFKPDQKSEISNLQFIAGHAASRLGTAGELRISMAFFSCRSFSFGPESGPSGAFPEVGWIEAPVTSWSGATPRACITWPD